MPETAVIETEPEFVPPIDALDEPIGPSPLDRREAAIAEAVATRLEDLRQDGVEIPPSDAEEAEAEDGETRPPEPEGDGRELLPGEPLYTVKVDGQERQVPLSELTTSYQIQSATRNRLAEAGVTLRRAQEMEQGVLERVAAPEAAPSG